MRPDSKTGGRRRFIQKTTAFYSFGWLVAANFVGLWLAALLIWPGLGKWAGAFTYGRWMPLHMDWQLYGWCALPLVGLLMVYFLAEEPDLTRPDVHLGFLGWSLAMGLGGVFALNGEVSGKLFLNWSGLSRIAFPTAQLLLWSILLIAAISRFRRIHFFDTKQLCLAGLLLVLLASPIALFLTADAGVYPPIDPESGGATGHSLLASTLGIVLIFGALPYMLQIPEKQGASRPWRRFAIAYLFSGLIWALIDHGNAANTAWNQILGLAVLLPWIGIVPWYYSGFDWPAPLRRWMGAFFFWWGFLTLSGFLSYLPGVLDLMKFSNGLVAHAHLAMAGMLGALNMVVLGTLGPCRVADPWSDTSGFCLWNGGTLLYVLPMLVQGVREGLDPTVLYGPDQVTTVLYSLRLIAGLLLLAASLRWLSRLERERAWPRKEAAALTKETPCLP